MADHRDRNYEQEIQEARNRVAQIKTVIVNIELQIKNGENSKVAWVREMLPADRKRLQLAELEFDIALDDLIIAVQEAK